MWLPIMNNYLVLDIENDNTKLYKRNAGNFKFDKIVAIALCNSRKVKTFYYNSPIFNNWENYLDRCEVLIGHNLKHDLLFLWKSKKLQNWINKGGKIYDTQLAEFILTGQQHKYPALRNIAVNKYKCPEREKVMEKYWDNGLMTSEIEKELVIKDVTNDVLDTEQVYLLQLKLAKSKNMLSLIESQMEGLLATTEIEYNGMFINPNIFNTNMTEMRTKLENLTIELQETVKKYWKFDEIEKFEGTPYQISKLFFGGNIKGIEKVEIINELGCPIIIKSGPNKGKIKTKNEEKIYLFDGFGLVPREDWKTKRPGIYSTDDSVLKLINKKIKTDAGKIANIMLEIRGLQKEFGTYYEGFKELIYPDNCIRGQLSHCGYSRGTGTGGGTETGRLSSIAPNLQNIPRGDK